jgi:hypothetical protein
LSIVRGILGKRTVIWGEGVSAVLVDNAVILWKRTVDALY